MNIAILETFADALKAKFSLPGAASPEDQLKPVVADLLTSAGAAYGLSVQTRTETHLSEHKVRPDIAIYVGGLICGYVELKAPGLGADAPRLKGEHNKTQWEKLKGLPNLIYTDGREWALYRGGDRPEGQPIVRLHDDPTDKGKAATTSVLTRKYRLISCGCVNRWGLLGWHDRSSDCGLSPALWVNSDAGRGLPRSACGIASAPTSSCFGSTASVSKPSPNGW